MEAVKVKKGKFLCVLTVLCVLMGAMATAQAAPLFNVPTRVTQPDGTELTIYSSGDEFFNYLHDESGSLILQNDEGWYTYARNQDGRPVASERIVGGVSLFSGNSLPAPAGMTVGDIDFAAHPDLIHALPVQDEAEVLAETGDETTQPQNANGPSNAAVVTPDQPTSKVAPKMANLVIFIRFRGEEEFVTGSMAAQDAAAVIPEKDRTEGGPDHVDFQDYYRQVSDYMQKVSNGLFDVETTFLTTDETGQAIMSYEDIYPRSFYEAGTAQNPGGSTEGNRFVREMQLLERAIIATADSLEAADWPNLDYDGDDRVDNITFIVSGSTGGWNDLLWPHSWALQMDKISLPSSSANGAYKLCFQFNFNFANPRYAGIGVLSHELLHSVGYPDLYRYDYSGDPVGPWDAMGSTDYADPQFLGAYLKDAYAGWGRVGQIDRDGRYTLYPIGTEFGADGQPPLEGYEIPTEVRGESIWVEYRKNGLPGSVTEDNVPRDGLLVYRANKKTIDGNRNGTVNGGDEVYVFRPEDAACNAGTAAQLKKAALSDKHAYTSLGVGKEDTATPAQQTIYYDGGGNTGVIISNVVENDDGTISFDVTLPKTTATPLEPGGPYDVDGDNWYISKSGEYTFTGSTTNKSITVAPAVTGVRIVLDNVTMDHANHPDSAPINLRRGAEVTVEVRGTTTLTGGDYVPGLLVEEGSAAAVTSAAGARLNANGGIGAPALGGTAFTSGGALTLDGLTATLTGGGAFDIIMGATIMRNSDGSAALGAGAEQVCQDLTISNSNLTIRGGSDLHSIATSHTYMNSNYLTGGNILITDSTINARGAILAGDDLTVKDSTLTVQADVDNYYGAALNALENIRLVNSNTRLQAEGVCAAINCSRCSKCRVEVLGGSLWGYAGRIGGAASAFAFSSDAQVFLATAGVNGSRNILQPPSEDQGKLAVTLANASDGTRAVLFQGTLTENLASTQPSLLTDGGSFRRNVELPQGMRTFLVSLPAAGSYSIVDSREAVCGPLNATLTSQVNKETGLRFQENGASRKLLDLSRGPATVAEDGSYDVVGTSTGASITVKDGKTVNLYLNGVDLTAPAGQSALTIEGGAQVKVIAFNRSENILRGGAGAPALRGESGSSVTLTGTGTLLALGGPGSEAVTADALLVDQQLDLTAFSDQSQAVARTGGSQGSWAPAAGVEPVLAFGRFAAPLRADATLTFAGDLTSAHAGAPAGTASFFHNLGRTDNIRILTDGGLSSPALACTRAVNDLGAVELTGDAATSTTVDLSKGSYVATKNGTYTVIGSTDENNFRVAPGVVATVILDNVDVRLRLRLKKDQYGILELGENSSVTVELPAGTVNHLEGGFSPDRPTCGIYVPATARLTIRGEGSLFTQGSSYGVPIGIPSAESHCGSITVEGGNLTFNRAGTGTDTIMGGAQARIDITGGHIVHDYDYGAVIGGSGSVVTISGGVLDLTGREHGAAIGGSGANVTVTGGEINFHMRSQAGGIGGYGAEIRIQGGRITSDCADATYPSTKFILGGENSRLTMTGGTVEARLPQRRGAYYGAFGGKLATASFSGGEVFLLYDAPDASPLCSDDLLNGSDNGQFLDVRFAVDKEEGTPVERADEVVRIVKNGQVVKTVTVPQEAYGFCVYLPQGVYDITDSRGAYGGTANLKPSTVVKLTDVEFNRVPGVLFEDLTVTYDGQYHTLELTGLDGRGDVSYTGHRQRQPGVYPVTATITANGASYQLTATLTIQKAMLTVTGAEADNKAGYDGKTSTTGRILFEGAAAGDQPTFSARYTFETADIGTNKKVTVSGISLDRQWEDYYNWKFAPGVSDPIITAADITGAGTVSVTINKNYLFQAAGKVVPVVYRTNPAGLPCTVTYNGSPDVPQAAGTYQVEVTIASPNYTGSATAALKVAEATHDISTGDLTISAAGDYVITGTSDRHTITVEIPSDTREEFYANYYDKTVNLYLAGVDLCSAEAGKSPIILHMSSFAPGIDINLIAVTGTENVLQGGPGAGAVYNPSSRGDRLHVTGGGRLTVLSGAGCDKIFDVVHTPAVSDSVQLTLGTDQRWTTGSSPESKNSLSSTWTRLVFAQAAPEDTAFTLQLNGEDVPLVLYKGCRSITVNRKGSYNSMVRVLDAEGRTIDRGVASTGVHGFYGLPLHSAIAGQEILLDVSDPDKWPMVIKDDGCYRVIGGQKPYYHENPPKKDYPPMLEIKDGVCAEIVLDNVKIQGRCDLGPLISMGRSAEITLVAKGENILYNCFDAIIAEAYNNSNTPTSSLTLRADAAGGSVKMFFDYYSGADSESGASSSAKVGACIRVGELTVESGEWTVTTINTKEDHYRWGIVAPKGFTMTGGSLRLCHEKEDWVQDNAVRSCSGIYTDGTMKLLGGKLDLPLKSGSYWDTYDSLHAGRSLVIDGAEVSIITSNMGSSGAAIYAPDVKLLSGSLTMALKVTGCKGFNGVQTMTLSPDFQLVACAAYSNPEATGNNLFVVSGGNIPTSTDSKPVLLKVTLGNPLKDFISGNSSFKLTITPLNAPQDAWTVTFPDLGDKSIDLTDYKWYQSLLLVLPEAGSYRLSYTVGGRTRQAEVVIPGGGYREATVEFSEVPSIPNLTFNDKTVTWDGLPHHLAVTGEPQNAVITYKNNGQTEPGTYTVVAEVTAAGYQTTYLNATLKILPVRLKVERLLAEDKPVYDGTTAATGQVILSGAINNDAPQATADFAFADADVGTDKTVKVTNIRLTDEWAGHYTLTQTRGETTASIVDKAPVDVTWLEPTLTQTYGSVSVVSAAAVDPLTVGQGEITGEQLRVDLTYGEDQSANMPTLPGSYSVYAQVVDKNYRGSGRNVLVIQPRPLTVTGVQVPAIRVGDSLTLAVADSAAFDAVASGVLQGDAVTLSYTAVYPDDTVGTDKTVAVEGLTLTGAQADRYRLSDTSAQGVGTVVDAQAPALASITVTAPAKTSYNKGDSLDTAGMTVTAHYEDGTTAPVAQGFTWSPTTLDTAGTVTVTVSYQGKTATFTVTVAETTGTGTGGGNSGGGNSSGGSGSSGSGSSAGGGASSSGKDDKKEEEVKPAEVQSGTGSDELGSLPVIRTEPMGFVDMETHWAREEVSWCYERGLLSGFSDTEFAPEAPMTRAMFVTALGRIQGIDPGDYAASPFTDVPADSWYGGYVAWAEAEGLIEGRGDGTFAPYDRMSREEIAVLLARQFQLQAGEEDAAGVEFTDLAEGSAWARDSVRTVCCKGLMKGYPDGSFEPRRTLNRAEAAALIHRLAEQLRPVE